MHLLSAKLEYQSRHKSFLCCDRFEMQSSAHAQITSVYVGSGWQVLYI